MTRSPVADDALCLPHVWRGRELAQAQEKTLSSGHASLDAELPGGGWPVGCLVEVLQAQPQQHVWQLLAPALRLCGTGPIVLVNPPYEPFGPGLRGQQLHPSQLLWVQTEKSSARLWATEQALRCADVSAVLAWLPQARAEELRRLHLCAQQHEKFLVVLRGVDARHHSSPARLRLLVEGVDRLEVQILKRRGPPLLQPLLLRSLPPRLSALLAARKSRRSAPVPVPVGSHVLDRTATLTE